MSRLPSASPPPSDSSGPTIPSDRFAPPDPPVLGRPPIPPRAGERIGMLLARVPVSPGRLLAMGGAAIVILIAGIWLLRPPSPPIESTLPRAASAEAHSGVAATTTPAASTRLRALVVAAAGSVRRPGLYRLRAGARVNDLVRAAGGLRPGADVDRINVAAPLADGQRLYVPRVGELAAPVLVGPGGGVDGQSAPTTTGSAGPSGSGDPGTPGSGAPIDLNTASAEQLDTLPGVGPSTAASILDYRTRNGPFHSVDDLLDVRGIGDAKLAALRAKVRV